MINKKKFIIFSPVPQVDPGVWFRMIRGLLDQLQEQLIDQAVLLHGLVQDSLDEEDVVLFFLVGRLLFWILGEKEHLEPGTHTYAHTHSHTHTLHTHTHCIHTNCIHTHYIHTHITYIHTLHTYTHYIHTLLTNTNYTHTHTHITYTHNCIHTHYIHTHYIHTHITYIHTLHTYTHYIHTQITYTHTYKHIPRIPPYTHINKYTHI
jgi:hypothetical protein